MAADRDNEIPNADQMTQATMELLAAFRQPYAIPQAKAFQLIHTYGAALTDHYAALIESMAKDAACEDDQDRIMAIHDALHGQGTKLTELAMRARDINEGRTPPTPES